MNDEIQSRIAQLVSRGWTLAAIADELGVTSDTVEHWKAGRRNPTNAKAVLAMLDKVSEKKRIPKQRRYAKGSRQGRKLKFEAGDRVVGNDKKASFRDRKGTVKNYGPNKAEYLVLFDDGEEEYVNTEWIDRDNPTD
jgi:transcriptional regulator with XRE-family HTH domain